MKPFKLNAKPKRESEVKPATQELRRFSCLSPSRQALVRLCQATNYGRVQDLEIRDRDPVFAPPPSVIIDLKLDADEGTLPALGFADFVLRDEVCRLMEQLDNLENGTIESIEVRSGLPRRILFRAHIDDLLKSPFVEPADRDRVGRIQGSQEAIA